MGEYKYAKGRVAESIQFISQELKEFEEDYAGQRWTDYQNDRKLQILMDRTVENILMALIEVCGAILTEEGISADNYSETLRKCGKYFNLTLTLQKIEINGHG